MDVVATSSLAIDNVILLRIEFDAANRAVILNRLANTTSVLGSSGFGWQRRSMIKDLLHFGAQESRLILQMIARLERLGHHVDNVLAVIALLCVRAIARRQLVDDDSVEVASRASDSYGLFRSVGSTCALALNDEHSLCLGTTKDRDEVLGRSLLLPNGEISTAK